MLRRIVITLCASRYCTNTLVRAYARQVKEWRYIHMELSFCSARLRSSLSTRSRERFVLSKMALRRDALGAIRCDTVRFEPACGCSCRWWWLRLL